MSYGNEQPAELHLAISNGDTVRCGRCGGVVDFGRSCELKREPGGHLEITRCHACLIARPRKYVGAVELLEIAGRIVEHVGHDGAQEEITRALTLPAPGSQWIYVDPRAPTDRLEFSFVRFAGDVLVFSGPFGDWICVREDWAHHLAARRVRPLLVPTAARV